MRTGYGPFTMRALGRSVPRQDGVRARRPAAALTLAALAVGAVVTTLIITIPAFVFGFRSPSAHLVVDTVDACIALLAAYLVYGRFLRSGRVQDLLLLQGLVLLAVGGLALRVVVFLLAGTGTGRLDVWLPLTVRLAAAVLIAAASVTSGRRVRWHGWGRWAATPPLAFVVLVWIVLGSLGSLPVALDPALSPVSAVRPLVVGHPLLLGAQGLNMLCFLLASVAFTVQARRGEDDLVRWLGPACALASFARLNYLLFPSIYSDWLYVGDLLRVAFFLLLLVGAAGEISEYWSRQTRAAVVEDRRRVARELHDGVVQELGFIRLESAGLKSLDPERSSRILGACDRAIDETRQAIEALRASGDEPLSVVLQRALRHVADRHGLDVQVDVEPSVSVGPEQRHTLVQIAREAVVNAARHSGARTVTVRVSTETDGRRLVVEDDGRGFDVDTVSPSAGGFGLTSMRERADTLPGEFDIRSTPGTGTAVTVRW